MKKSHISLGAVAGITILLASCGGGSGSGAMSAMSSAEIAAMKSQTTGVDTQGNVVELGEFFTYGGDNMAEYSDGKLATGVQDPAVCGSFSAAKCSVGHLK